MTPHSKFNLFCLPPHRGKQNPAFVEVNIWASEKDAKAHFRSIDTRWNRDAIAYFLDYQDPSSPPLVGETHFTLRRLSISSVAHEFVHAADVFAHRHKLSKLKHCPYEIGNSREECVAYVLGTLMDGFFKKLPPNLLRRWLKNSFQPLA